MEKKQAHINGYPMGPTRKPRKTRFEEMLLDLKRKATISTDVMKNQTELSEDDISPISLTVVNEDSVGSSLSPQAHSIAQEDKEDNERIDDIEDLCITSQGKKKGQVFNIMKRNHKALSPVGSS